MNADRTSKADTSSTESTGRDTRDVTSVDRLLGALANHRRRRVIARLEATGAREALSMDALVVDDDHRGDRVQLYHRHLPKLAEVGLVEWNRDEGLVRPGTRFDEASRLLDLVREYGQPPGTD